MPERSRSKGGFGALGFWNQRHFLPPGRRRKTTAAIGYSPHAHIWGGFKAIQRIITPTRLPCTYAGPEGLSNSPQRPFQAENPVFWGVFGEGSDNGATRPRSRQGGAVSRGELPGRGIESNIAGDLAPTARP